MKFIVIDGLDGSGKDTQIDLLAKYYRNQGKNVVVRSHPCDDNKYGRKSRQALQKTGKFNHIKATTMCFNLENDVISSNNSSNFTNYFI